MINPFIAQLNELGQSIWYDNLSKDVLNSGELKQIISAGVSGLTSNPTIFKNAIAGSANYDQQLKELAKNGVSAELACEELMVNDVAAAADLLFETYQTSKGADGYASIEVSPLLAKDREQTVLAAKRLWQKLNRPNIMIKIPGTKECLPAIKEVLASGINVNITLLFSVDRYREVANQYISALSERVSKSLPVTGLASVASFFVSRVDAILEQAFDKLQAQGILKPEDKAVFFGKAGIANCKITYEAFQQLFNSEAFKKLEQKGARLQRPLWASTGTKNPVFSPLLYVEALAGQHTVNTLPPATLKALLASANIQPVLHDGLEDARETLKSIEKLGINFEEKMQELETQGVKLFAEAYQDLIAAVDLKLKSFS